MPQCPSNPLFYSWIKELRDDAREKDNKSCHSYSRAMKALCSYPIPLRSGEEAKSIQHVGDKIARILDRKTAEYYKERGYRDSEIQYFMVSCALEKLPTVREKMKKDLVSKSRKRKKTSPPSSDSHDPPDTAIEEFDKLIHQIEKDTSELPSTSNHSSGRKKCKREKVQILSSPNRRTNNQSMSPVNKEPPTNYVRAPSVEPMKIEVKQEAEFIPSYSSVTIESRDQPSSAKSPTERSRSPIPEAVSTSFSNISSVLDSVRATRPRSPGTPPLISWSPTPECSILDCEDDSDPGLSEPPDGEWRFTYLDENNVETNSRSRAAFLESSDMTGLWLRAKTYASTMGKCEKLFVEGSENLDNDLDPRYKIINIEVSYCPLRAPGLPRLKALKSKTRNTIVDKACSGGENSAQIPDFETETSPSNNLSKQKSKFVKEQDSNSKKHVIPDISDSEDEFDHSWFDNDRLSQVISIGLKPPSNAPWLKNTPESLSPQSISPAPESKREQPSSSRPVPEQPSSSRSKLNKPTSFKAIHSVPEVMISNQINGNANKRVFTQNKISTKVPTSSTLQTINVTEESASKTTPILFKFRPRSFEIKLCVDNAEVNSKKQQLLLKELDKNGVSYDVRKLQVGDFLWIAVDGEKRELVLDVVVERKRMDDLAQSITGGRFTEQKLRLKSCGLSRKVYLVETKASYLSLPEQSLNQAVVNTQVIDGFTIKKTHDIRETAAYLTILTRYLSGKYRDRELCAITEPTCTTESQLLTFRSFSEHSVKNRVFTVGEVWLKQLSRIPKISQDKAEAIVQVYPTLGDMKRATESVPSKDQIVADVKFGFGRRKIGGAASKAVAGLFSDSPLH